MRIKDILTSSAYVLCCLLVQNGSNSATEKMDSEIKVKLEWKRPSEEILTKYGRPPGLDFEDRGWISRKPIERLKGLPSDSILFYGIFDLSAESIIVKQNGMQKATGHLWRQPWAGPQADSRISFINTIDDSGREAFYFDTDNDEDLSNEEAVFPKDWPSSWMTLVGKVLPGFIAPYGASAESIVRFQYNDGSDVLEKEVAVEVVKFEQYIKKRPPGRPKFRGTVYDLRVGTAELGGKQVDLAILNGRDAATYHNRSGNYVLFDLNRDGVFDNRRGSAEFYQSDKPFNIHGMSLEVGRISSSGDQIVFGPAGEAVEPKRELVAGLPAPDFQVVDLKGDTLRLSSFQGKHLLLDFWFTTCAPCIAETPELVDIYQNRGESLEILGVSVDRSREAVIEYVAKNGVEWHQVLQKENQTKLTDLYNIGRYPSYVWIGPDGRIVMPEASLDALRGISPR